MISNSGDGVSKIGTQEASIIVGAQASLLFILPFMIDSRINFEKIPGLLDVSFSGHKDTFPVYSSKSSTFTGFTEGYKTKAGSFVFNFQEEAPLNNLIHRYNEWLEIKNVTLLDSVQDLPPLDALLVFVSEQPGGEIATINIKGLKFIDDSMRLTIEASPSIQTVSWIAKSISLPRLEEKITYAPHRTWRPFMPSVVATTLPYTGTVTLPTVTTTATTTPVPPTTIATTTLPATTTATTTLPATTTVITSTTSDSFTITTGVIAPLRPAIGSPVVISLDSSRDTWYDTGVFVAAGQQIALSVGADVIDNNGDDCYSEGFYTLGYPGSFDEALVEETSSAGTGGWAANNIRPHSVGIAISYSKPTRGINNALQLNRSYTTSAKAGKVWVIFNDTADDYTDNVGSFSITLILSRELS